LQDSLELLAQAWYKRKDMAKSMKVGGGGRYQKLVKKLKEEGANDPKALAAHIGRKKYGKKKFQQMAAKGRKRAS